jgi:hypothetical protein
MFFLTRIVFHAYLIISFAVPSAMFGSISISAVLGIGAGRDLVQSATPGCLLLAAMPMHVMWFAGGLRGHLRRCRRGAANSSQATSEASIINEQELSTPLHVTTTYSAYHDPSPSLGSASPGDTPLLTPYGGAEPTLDDEWSAERFFPPLGEADNIESSPVVLPPAKKRNRAADAVPLGTVYTFESILSGPGGRRRSGRS